MKLHAPAASRNCQPIAEVLRSLLPERGLILEVASGSGQHVAAFAQAFPQLVWQPSDLDPAAIASIDAWRQEGHYPQILPALRLDAGAGAWPEIAPVGIININMIHISPWSACTGLFRHAERLKPEWVFLYGPFFVAGQETAPSNLAFDASLRGRDPAWGVRQLEDVAAVAAERGFALERRVEMPANNLSVVFRNVGR